MRGRPEGSGVRPLGVTAGLVTLLLGAGTPACGQAAPDLPPAPLANADSSSPASSRERWFSLGLLAGTTQFDSGLADYQWNTLPRMAWGARAMAGAGRLAAGVRLWSTRTTQSIGDLGPAPGVRATSLELVGEGRLIEGWGMQLLATAGAGRLHLGYHPDRITIQPSGSGAIEVDLAPVDEWIAGAGVALRREVMPGWAVALDVGHRIFAIDTAHRAGSEVVLARETFGDWSARFELARVHRWR